MLAKLNFIVLTLLLVGCTNMCKSSRPNMSPEEVVESYLNTSLNMTQISQVNELVTYTTGNLRNVLEATSNEVFEKAFINKTYKLLRFSVLERRDRTPRELEITYQLQYNQLDKTQNITAKNAATITAEHTLSLIKKDGVWYIQDLLGSKASIDFPVSDESKITPTNGPSSP